MKERCSICGEHVNGPCRTNEEALQDGCINPTRQKRGLDAEVADRVARQSVDIHGKSSGPGSWSN